MKHRDLQVCLAVFVSVLFTMTTLGFGQDESIVAIPTDLNKIRCSPEQEAAWTRASIETLGSHGKDPLAGTLGFVGADRNIGNDTAKILLNIFFFGSSSIIQAALSRNWNPVTGQRETM